jgi:transcriptional regulator of aromatic amino acid metabolism
MPLIEVNCAAIPENLVEAELFGFERGAFTDAKPGLFQAAHRGVLFLDEVRSLPPAIQAKLLTAPEQREVRRLDSTRSEPVDVWIFSATNEDLSANVARGAFRLDLYHRISTVKLQMPPLRARGRDVITLANHFLERLAQARHPPGIPRPMVDGINDLAMRFGGRPFLNQTKQLSRAVVGAHSAPVGMRSVSSSPPRIKTGDSGTVSSMRCSRPMARVPLVSPGGTLAGGGGSSESTTLRAIRCWAGRR